MGDVRKVERETGQADNIFFRRGQLSIRGRHFAWPAI